MTTRKNEAAWIESRSRWQINIQDNGERKTFTASTPGTKGKIEAERKADKWIKSKQTLVSIRLGQLFELFLEDMDNATGKGNWKNHEKNGRLYLLPKLKSKKAASLTCQDWQDRIYEAAKAGAKGKPLSKKSLENIRETIGALYRFAKRNKIPMERPEDLIIPTTAQKPNKKILQPEDMKKLFTCDTVTVRGKEVRAFYIYTWRFILLSGLRRGEICGLQSDFIKDNVLHIPGTKTDAADRYIFLSQHLRQVLDDQAAMLKEAGIISPYLFPDTSGKRLYPNILYKHWWTYRNQHGITCSLHELRHTFISVAKSDMPEELLKMTVGHTAKTDTFGIYGHQVDGDLERAARISDQIFTDLLTAPNSPQK